MGRLNKIAPIIYAITKVDLAALSKERTVESYSFAQRLSWAANRNTTKFEDETCCLLGMMDVSLEVKYGVGRAAFQELQRKLLESGTSDDSIFAWTENLASGPSRLFAPSPAGFQDAGDVMCWRPRLMSSSFSFRSDGLAARVCLVRYQQDGNDWQGEVALLNCTKGIGSDKVLGLHLDAISEPSHSHAGSEYGVVAVQGQLGPKSASRLLSADRHFIVSAPLRDVTILLKAP